MSCAVTICPCYRKEVLHQWCKLQMVLCVFFSYRKSYYSLRKGWFPFVIKCCNNVHEGMLCKPTWRVWASQVTDQPMFTCQLYYFLDFIEGIKKLLWELENYYHFRDACLKNQLHPTTRKETEQSLPTAQPIWEDFLHTFKCFIWLLSRKIHVLAYQ